MRYWWEDRDPPPKGGEHAEHAEHGQKPHTYGANGVRQGAGQETNTFGSPTEYVAQEEEAAEHVRHVLGKGPNNENGIGKPKTNSREEVFGAFGMFGSSKDDPGMDF